MKRGIKWAIVVIVVLVTLPLLSPLTIVRAGHRGVVTQFGAVSGRVLGEGIHWITPVVDTVTKINVQVRKEETDSSAASKDLQSVSARVAVNYHLDATKVHLLYQEVGTDYGAKIVSPATQEAVKAVTAQFTAEELITRREDVKTKMKDALRDALLRRYIILDDVLITNFDFSPEFNRAIESKQTAVQDALRAENDLRRIKTEAEQRVAQAQAEAQAIRLQSDAANNQNYVQLKALEVQLEAVKKWDGKLPTQMVPGSAVPFLNLGTQTR